MALIDEHLGEIEGIIDQMTRDGHGTEDLRIMAGINAIASGVRATRRASKDVKSEQDGSDG